MNWVNHTSPKDGVQNIILDFFISRGCEQFVRMPTRFNNILDVILTDSPILIDSLKVINPLGNRDHCVVRFNVSVKYEVSCEPSSDGLRYLWCEADYTGPANYVNTVNWFNMLTTNLTTDSLWRAFTDTLNSSIKTLFLLFLYVTSRVGAFKIKQHPKHIRNAMSTKHCLWKRHRQNPSSL